MDRRVANRNGSSGSSERPWDSNDIGKRIREDQLRWAERKGAGRHYSRPQINPGKKKTGRHSRVSVVAGNLITARGPRFHGEAGSAFHGTTKNSAREFWPSAREDLIFPTNKKANGRQTGGRDASNHWAGRNVIFHRPHHGEKFS